MFSDLRFLNLEKKRGKESLAVYFESSEHRLETVSLKNWVIVIENKSIIKVSMEDVYNATL